MADASETAHHFDTDNRAWKRFTRLLDEHFTVVDWVTDNGRRVMITLVDLSSRDMFTIALVDSLEVRDTHALLTVNTSGDIAAHGPFDGGPAAADHAPQLALRDLTLAASRVALLHHPDQRVLPDDAWLPLPADMAANLRPALTDTRSAALVLLDRGRALLTVVGPFPTYQAADDWRPAPDLDPDIDRLVVPLHAAPPADTTS